MGNIPVVQFETFQKIILNIVADPGTPLSTDGASTSGYQTPNIKRGPGRPRLKPGPGNQGYRGVSRPRKHVGPLVVPLGQSPAATPLVCSPAMSPSQSPALIMSFKHETDDDDDDESEYVEL
jgi:hypothetical protein